MAVAGLPNVALIRPGAEARARDLFLAVTSTGWLGYTYVYPSLNLFHTTLPACPFLAITGHPCPFCGGTRSFSALWRGDLGAALHLYPLGPLLFVSCFAVAAYGLFALASRRSVALRLSHRFERWITVAGVGLIGSSWALKLVWLGN